MKRFVLLLLLLLTACPPPAPIIIPSERALIAVEQQSGGEWIATTKASSKPGYFIITAGHLLDLADREERLQAEVRRCRLTSPPPQ